MKSIYTILLLAVLMLVGYIMNANAFNIGSTSKAAKVERKEILQQLVQVIPPKQPQMITRKIIDALVSYVHPCIPKISEESSLLDGSIVVSLSVDARAGPIEVLTDEMRRDIISTLRFLSSVGLSLEVSTKRELVDCFVVGPFSDKISFVRISSLRFGKVPVLGSIIQLIDFQEQI